jgi:hypothetical protein
MSTPQAVASPPKPTPRPPSRMTLSSVVKGKQAQPIRALVYGVEGIGKSSFGAAAPAPIFLGAEDGTAQLDTVRFPSPESWEEVMDAVRLLTTETHEYKTLVVDTLDWAEPLLWAYICKRDNQKDIEGYGYGKGFQAALDEWRVLLAALEKLRRTKGMHVVLIAHSWVKAFKNPQGEDYDRYEMKLNAKAAGLLKEWADCVLFAQYETLVSKDGKTKRTRGVDTGARLLYTERRAAYDAKNRYGLPEALPLSWPDFEAAVLAHQPADPKALVAELERKAALLGGKAVEDVAQAIKRAAGDATKLAVLNNWCNAELSAREQ